MMITAQSEDKDAKLKSRSHLILLTANAIIALMILYGEEYIARRHASAEEISQKA